MLPQGDAGAGKSVEMKVSKSRANLLCVETLVPGIVWSIVLFFLPQDIEMMFEAYGIKVSSRPDASVKF